MNALRITGPQPRKLSHICYDSRQARRNSVFVAIRGNSLDGHDYIREAVRNGARTVVAERKPDFRLPGRVTLVLVPDSRAALAQLADYFYDSPSELMNVIGVTGTNGKTTVTYLLRSILKAAGKMCGAVGTISHDLVGEDVVALNTTPESLDLQRMMNIMVNRGAEYCLLEVSSHALSQSRVDHVAFRTAVFTNLTQDHLDYHGNMEKYFKAKTRLFTERAPEVCVINADDPYASRLMAMIEADVYTYGLTPDADVTAEDVTTDIDGTSFTLKTPAGAVRVRSKLAGAHNVYNIMASAGAAHAEGLGLDQIAEGVERLVVVPGRFEKVEAGQPFAVVVDYAHTDDALANILIAARELTTNRLITLFGCGGDRDRGKRPMMGRTARRMSDRIVVTSDNPRTENPDEIIRDILTGMKDDSTPEKEMKVIPDRREAIREAVNMATQGDVVVIAGKGHEDYQIVGNVRRHFDDREEVLDAIKERYGGV